MSGPFGSSQWMYNTGAGGFYPYEIDQSLRFNDDDSAYLSRTPASAGNRKTWTWSGWVKRGNLGAQGIIFSASNGVGTSNGAVYTNFQFNAANQIEIIDYIGSDFGGPGVRGRKTSTAVFRDPSAYYHVHVAFDTSKAVAADRIKVWVNGEQITSFGTSVDIPLNADTYINTTASHALSSLVYGTRFGYFDGYLAEVNFIDGSALDPTSFGEFKSGIWVPKEYTGTYGTNGYYLPFSDSAAIGDDLSGNTNDWTPSGLASTDVMLDSPTNNWCSFNSVSGTGTLSDGNLRSASGAGTQPATFLVQSGKWYWEAKGDKYSAAICGPDGQDFAATISTTGSKGLGWFQTGPVYWDGGTNSPTSLSYTASDILGIALDMDAGTITFYKNNVLYTTLTFGSGTVPAFADGVFPAINGGGSTAGVHNLNFGQDSSFAGAVTRQGNTDANGVGDFYYAPPAGYLALCTVNLPAPAVDPAVDDVPADYFNTVLYTGTGAAQSITGVGFQPDWTWIKGRSGATDHALYDAVRGVQEQLESNQTGAETTEATGLTAFGADGFSVGALAQLNTSTATYVAWNWLAGNGTSSNTDGTITSTVSVNQKAGFSIVSWAGTSSVGTVGHGLGAAPDLIITRPHSVTGNWFVWHRSVTSGNGKYLYLNLTAGLAGPAGTPVWDATNTTTQSSTSVFDVGANTSVNGSGQDHIAYCFAEVDGFSKFGSYTGNGSTDGPFVYCGFRPAFVMIKSSSSAYYWIVRDALRDNYNATEKELFPNDSLAETVAPRATDFLSNGFKFRHTGTTENQSGQTYIFMAFAEAPFKYSNAR